MFLKKPATNSCISHSKPITSSTTFKTGVSEEYHLIFCTECAWTLRTVQLCYSLARTIVHSVLTHNSPYCKKFHFELWYSGYTYNLADYPNSIPSRRKCMIKVLLHYGTSLRAAGMSMNVYNVECLGG